MLQLENGRPLMLDDYSITHRSNGADELRFRLPIDSDAYREIAEEERVLETSEGQTYVVRQIDAGETSAEVICGLDLDDWRIALYLDYANGNTTLQQTLSPIVPPGWSMEGATFGGQKCDIHMTWENMVSLSSVVFGAKTFRLTTRPPAPVCCLAKRMLSAHWPWPVITGACRILAIERIRRMT